MLSVLPAPLTFFAERQSISNFKLSCSEPEIPVSQTNGYGFSNPLKFIDIINISTSTSTSTILTVSTVFHYSYIRDVINHSVF